MPFPEEIEEEEEGEEILIEDDNFIRFIPINGQVEAPMGARVDVPVNPVNVVGRVRNFIQNARPLANPIARAIIPNQIAANNEILMNGDYFDKPPLTLTKEKHICFHCKKNLSNNDSSDDGCRYYVFDSVGPGYRTDKKKLFICGPCREHFPSCLGCKKSFTEKNLTEGYCKYCIDTAPKARIRKYSHKVEDFFGMLGENPKDEMRYGVELELESSNLGLDVLKVDNLVQKFANLKSDSSIKAGFEIVSAPATIEEHYHLWDEFFQKLPQTSNPLRSCGMHVHASRSRLSDLQIGKILVFLHHKNNREFIKLIAGRESNHHNNFETSKSFKDARVFVRDHHTALNLNKENTIEFRIFWATRDKRIFFKNLEFVKAIIKFCDSAANSINESADYKKFVEWVRKNRKEYEYLSLFFDTPSMQKLLGE